MLILYYILMLTNNCSDFTLYKGKGGKQRIVTYK